MSHTQLPQDGKYYKLLWSSFPIGTLHSYLVNERPYLRSQLLEYKPDCWNYPQFGKLFVFDSLYNLYSFLTPTNNRVLKVFECEVKNPVRIKYQPGGSDYVEFYQQFWKNKQRHKKLGVYTRPSHKGTVVCDAVKLIREI